MKTEVLVIGGGPAGLTMACLLGTAGINVICVDRESPETLLDQNFDGRTIVLSAATQRVLKAAGVWDAMAPHAGKIMDIRVVDGESPSFLHFDCEDVGGEAFGWNVENRIIRASLFEQVKNLDNVTHISEACVKEYKNCGSSIELTLEDGKKIEASLVIGADGRGSTTREWLGIETKGWSYNQTALICCTEHELDHENVALEHFRPTGPFAILPMSDGENGAHRSSIVWSDHPSVIEDALNMSEDEFNTKLQDLFGPHLGAVKAISPRKAFPLSLMHAQSYIGPRTALIGESAHAIHPVAGQGLNLSMRDIAYLAELVVDSKRLGLDIGSETLLNRYNKVRKKDNTIMAVVSDGLVKLFSNDIPPVRGLRDFGIGFVNKVPPLKSFFERQAMGLAGDIPRIIKGEPL